MSIKPPALIRIDFVFEGLLVKERLIIASGTGWAWSLPKIFIVGLGGRKLMLIPEGVALEIRTPPSI